MSANADDEPSYNLSARILTTSILSLTFVVLLLIVLHLYARCILNRSVTHNTQVSIFRVASNPEIRVASNPEITPQTPNGLDQSTIDLLPTFSYRKKEELTAECPVCLSPVDAEEMVRVLPKCKHLFHVECIDMWLHSHSSCPVCRATVELVSGSGDSGLVSRVGSSLRRLMSRDRSGRRTQGEGSQDMERQ